MTRVWSVVMTGLLVLVFGLSAQAATLEWDRNSEADMKDYFVLQCLGTGCTVDPLSSAVNVVPQSPVGVKPSAQVTTTNQEGAFAVKARDLSGNLSGLSVPLPFDARSPAAPANPVLR